MAEIQKLYLNSKEAASLACYKHKDSFLRLVREGKAPAAVGSKMHPVWRRTDLIAWIETGEVRPTTGKKCRGRPSKSEEIAAREVAA